MMLGYVPMFWEKSTKILPVSIVTGTMATASATYVVMSQPLERFIKSAMRLRQQNFLLY